MTNYVRCTLSPVYLPDAYLYVRTLGIFQKHCYNILVKVNRNLKAPNTQVIHTGTELLNNPRLSI